MKFRVGLILLLSIYLTASLYSDISTQIKEYYELDSFRKNDVELMDISQVKRGMRGFGITVFEGVKIERFEVEVLGVLKNEGPESDLILARFDGGPLKKTGVIAGMSGSPVYIDGKLVGAVSHAYTWAKEPLGMIRPIKEMINILNRENFYPTEEDKPIFIPLETSLYKEKNKKFPEFFQKSEPNKYLANVEGRSIELKPVMTPILFSGIDKKLVDLMSEKLKSYGYYPIQNGSGGRMTNVEGIERSLYPGDAVGINLISGDMNATVLGTVSYRDRDKVLLFGHPSFFKGPIDMPMTKEYVHVCVPTRNISFKVSSTLFPVGHAYNDKNTAVAGKLGVDAPTIPVDLYIKDDNYKKSFNFKIVKDNVFFPNLLSAALTQSIYNVNNQAEENTIKLRFEIKVRNVNTNKVNKIIITDFITGGDTSENMFISMFRITEPLEILFYNEFSNVSVESVTAHFDILPGWVACKVEKVRLLKSPIKPGEEIPLLITLKPFKGKRFYKKVSIRIPKNVKTDHVVIGVSNAKAEMLVDQLRSSGRFYPRSYDHLIRLLNRYGGFNDLAIWIDIPNAGLIVDGIEMGNLPSSILTMYGMSRESGSVLINGRVRRFYRSNYFIYGLESISVDIKK